MKGGVPATGTEIKLEVLDWESIQPIFEKIQAQIDWDFVISVLKNTSAASIIFVAGWWGVRKFLKVFMSAFRKGRISM